MSPRWIERPTVDLDLDRPLANLLASLPAECVGAGKRLLHALAFDLPGNLQKIAEMARLRTGDRFQREIQAVATTFGVEWHDVMIANLCYDLRLASLGCSTMALPTRFGPVLARNMDWWPEQVLAQSSYLFRYIRHHKLLFATAGFPGAVGVISGMSGRGFAIALNAATSFEGPDLEGYPVLLLIRRVLEEAGDFEEAVQQLAFARLTVGAIFTVVGSENRERVVIERSPKRQSQRWPAADEPLVATNHYRQLDNQPEPGVNLLYETTCGRYDRLVELLAKHDPAGEAPEPHLLYLLTDPEVEQEITAQHILFRPKQQIARLFVPSRHLEG